MVSPPELELPVVAALPHPESNKEEAKIPESKTDSFFFN